MKLFIFSVYDSKADAFTTPSFFKTIAESGRAFADVARDKTNMIGAHPEDFTLFRLGEFDDKTGVFKMEKTPISMGLAVEYAVRDSDG